jgi:hypothetical protein
MSNVYDFRKNRSIKNVNPQDAGEELECIRAEKGVLVADDVVERAKDEASPLHHAFEWDNEAAGHQHRLNQARRLITSIRVLNSPASKPIVAFVSVKTPDRGRSYMPTAETMSDDDLKHRVLNEIRESIESLERRYAHFQEIQLLLQNLKKQVG